MYIEENKISKTIEDGAAVLGIELGSTRIKAVLTGEDNLPIATGCYEWENKFINNIWTYDLDEVWAGLQGSYKNLADNVRQKYHTTIQSVRAIGISGMMHGYLVFDKEGELLAPFRTWRNTNTKNAAEELSNLFNYHIPQRWSIAHLYQAIINKEQHVEKINYLTTLSAYVHWKLTGNKVAGVGEASGMFPIDINTRNYNNSMLLQFDSKISSYDYSWKLEDILPKVLAAGEEAGTLTEEGAVLLDITGQLKLGIPLCPPEGDAGTGMVATNSVAKRTGNVSAGTSVFSMIVLERELTKTYPEIDLVTTPSGNLTAMVHCNNCTTDLNAWISLFKEFADVLGAEISLPKMFEMLYNKALEGDMECSGLLAYNYLSGEHITNMEEGRPLFVRTPESNFNLANFMRVHLYTALSALKIGMDILVKNEGVQIEQLNGHGGLFKTKNVGQYVLAASMNVPVCIMETAGEGGAWGIALLASYLVNKNEGETLEVYLNEKVFVADKGIRIMPDAEAVAGYEAFIKRYTEGFVIERAAIDALGMQDTRQRGDGGYNDRT